MEGARGIIASRDGLRNKIHGNVNGNAVPGRNFAIPAEIAGIGIEPFHDIRDNKIAFTVLGLIDIDVERKKDKGAGERVGEQIQSAGVTKTGKDADHGRVEPEFVIAGSFFA